MDTNNIELLNKLPDEELVKLAKEDNQVAIEVLLKRYEALINSLTKKIFINRSVDKDDLAQECRYALTKAMKNYNFEKDNKFLTYAHQCINNRLYDIVRSNNTVNAKGFNDSLSIVEEDGTVTERIADTHVIDPLAQAIRDENKEYLYKIAKEVLPKKQYDVLVLHLNGYSYTEIVEKLKLDNPKQVDNALAAAKRTLQKKLK